MDLREVHAVAIAAAKEAGAAIRGYYKDEYTVRDKGEDNPLTDADLASDRIIDERIRFHFPESGYLSEERADDRVRLTLPDCWIVDPLDGTREFTLGIPEFCVSIGYIQGEKPTVGVLYNPITDQLFSGIVGVGAWLNGEEVRVSQHAQLDGARVVCSRSEMKKGWFDPWKEQLDLKPVGSVAYKFGLVAAGLAESTFTNKPRNEWDLAGGVAVLHAAGGRSSNRHGQPYRFNQPNPLKDGVCGTNGVIHDDILGVMKQQAQ